MSNAGERLCRSGFSAVKHQVVDLENEVSGIKAERAYFDTAPRGVFQNRDCFRTKKIGKPAGLHDEVRHAKQNDDPACERGGNPPQKFFAPASHASPSS